MRIAPRATDRIRGELEEIISAVPLVFAVLFFGVCAWFFAKHAFLHFTGLSDDWRI